MVKRFTQGARDDSFTHFRAEVVPELWLLTKKIQSRIFQHLSVPDILRDVLSELNVAFEILGTYHPRDYCVQYRESDFDFVSRLMEEEGIYYFFKHSQAGHQMVVADVSNRHPFVPGTSTVIFGDVASGVQEDMRVTVWEKTQELRAGEYTLWDHCFELPGNHLEASESTTGSIPVGKAVHKLGIGGNHQLEIYEYPGGYAQRFDGIDRNGVPQPQDLQTMSDDRQRTVRLRMEQEETASLEIRGSSDCGHFLAGHKFTLKRHFDADDQYLLTRVEHDARLGGYESSHEPVFKYENRFICIPVALPYRPRRVTSKPVIAGVQTATVVGPAGEELFCDKYGRVKVQFHWDREGKMDSNSSCWLRVAQVWAGSGWGAFFWPRIGNEVVVTFEEGDPDQPLIIGSLYNAENMPPFELPAKNNLAGLKSASVRGKAYKNFNGLVFDDAKGREHLAIHSERHMSFNSELDKLFQSGRHKAEQVSHVSIATVGHLPGGGSGGGPDPYAAWAPPDAHGVGGLNGVTVYGENLQAVVGLNHQLAIGSNLQVCINPGGLAAGVSAPSSPVLNALLGSGIGGNMQFTIGTSANFVFGQAFDLSLGPDKIETVPGDHPDTMGLCGLLGAVYFIWMFLYAAVQDNADRCSITLVSQVLIDLLLNSVVKAELAHFEATDDGDKLLTEILFGICQRWGGWRPAKEEASPAPNGLTAEQGFCTGMALLLAAVAPAAADIATASTDKDSSS